MSTVRDAVFAYLLPSPHPCNSLVKALTSNVMVLEGREVIGLGEVMT